MPSEVPTTPARPTKPVERWAVISMAILAGTGVLGLLLYSYQCAESASVLGAGIMIIGASGVAGGALGFLFGIPRAVAAHGADAAASNAAQPVYVANTNLEQVSNWLTTLLIGAGLTQLGSIGHSFHQLATDLAPALGARSDSAAFAAALVLEFLLLGFLTGWLLTRLILASVLSQADRRALDSFVRAEILTESGDLDQADDLRAHAMGELGLLGAEADKYEAMRRDLSSGAGRTARMQDFVDAARANARETSLTAAQVREFFASGGEGQRIYALALMQGDPALVDIDSMLDALARSRSAFEQYQALVVAELTAPALEAGHRERLRETLTEQLGASGRIGRTTSRRHVAERILAAIDATA